MERKQRQLRMIPTTFTVREDGEQSNPIIEGYFAVFGDVYDIAPGMSESIAPGAFARSLSGDIRALINHDTTLVLGRTKAHTLELQEDARGLWGRITINPNDVDAVSLYERVKRGDVDGCSIGFDIIKEDTEVRNDGSIHWTIRDVDLYEVSCCTFPAYEATNIEARTADRKKILEKRNGEWQEKQKGVLKKWH